MSELDEHDLIGFAKGWDSHRYLNGECETVVTECLNGARVALSITQLLDKCARGTAKRGELSEAEEMLSDVSSLMRCLGRHVHSASYTISKYRQDQDRIISESN